MEEKKPYGLKSIAFGGFPDGSIPTKIEPFEYDPVIIEPIDNSWKITDIQHTTITFYQASTGRKMDLSITDENRTEVEKLIQGGIGSKHSVIFRSKTGEIRDL